MSDKFPFDEGDRVLVRVRSNGGTSGRLEGKFVATCEEFRSKAPGMSPMACLDPPWTQFGTIDLHYYDAEFEVLEDDETPQF